MRLERGSRGSRATGGGRVSSVPWTRWQDDIVKLQVVTLAAKLYLAGLDRSDVLMPYVFSLAKYDLNYDVRDRVRAPDAALGQSAGWAAPRLTRTRAWFVHDISGCRRVCSAS